MGHLVLTDSSTLGLCNYDCAIIWIISRMKGFTWTYCSLFPLSSLRPIDCFFLLTRHCSFHPSLHPTALSVCWAGMFPFPSLVNMNPPSCHLLIIISPSFHTSSSLLCWWGLSPTQDVWVCSSPPLPLLRCSLAPSLNGAPSPRRRGRAARGPLSPFSQSHGTTGSTVSLGKKKCRIAIFHYEANFHSCQMSL